MALTKSDFEKYGVNEVLARRDGGFDALCFLNVCQDESKRLNEAGDDKGAYLFWLFAAINSMFFDHEEKDLEAPFIPMWRMNGQRSFFHDDLTDEELDFLTDVVCAIEEPKVRARVADVLWLRRRVYKFATCAFDSYLESIEMNIPAHYVGQQVVRMLQLAKHTKNKQMTSKALGVAKEFADKQLCAGKIASWSRFVEILAIYVESNERAEHVEQIWEQAAAVERTGDFDFSIRLRELCLGLFRKIKNHQRAREGQIVLADILACHSKKVAEAGDAWRASLGMQHALSHLPEGPDTKSKREEMLALLVMWGKKLDEAIEKGQPAGSMEYKRIEGKLPEETVDVINSLAEDTFNIFKERPLLEALFVLVALPRPANANEIRTEAHEHRQGSIAPRIASFQESRAGKIVGRNWPFTVAFYAELHRCQQVLTRILPAILQIEKENEVDIDSLAKLLERSPFVPPSSRRTMARGLLAGINSDWVVVAHILPSQLERAFRAILDSKGVDTSKWDLKLISKEKTLGWMLKQPELAEKLGKDLVLDLQTLLVEDDNEDESENEGGTNLRNNVSHGLLDDTCFFVSDSGIKNPTLVQVIYLWWLTLRLCLFHQADEYLTTHNVAPPSPDGGNIPSGD